MKIKTNDKVLNQLALYFLLEYGKINLKNVNYYNKIIDNTKKSKNKIIPPDYQMTALEMSKELAKLSQEDICKFIRKDIPYVKTYNSKQKEKWSEMKNYKDDRINTILSNLELDMKKDEEYSYRPINSERKELCRNIDKIVEYVDNGKKGKLYLNSNIWEICRQALSDILKMYDLKFIGSDKITDHEEIVPLNYHNKNKYHIER